jgi:hypothetical protein
MCKVCNKWTELASKTCTVAARSFGDVPQFGNLCIVLSRRVSTPDDHARRAEVGRPRGAYGDESKTPAIENEATGGVGGVKKEARRE